MSQSAADSPQISVVITCFNQAEYLGEAIESVLCQVYQDFEIIVIDDGSLDRTPAVAKRYIRARYLRQSNRGLSAARNTGIRASRGRFLVFLDADDRLLSEALAAGLRDLEAHPVCAFTSGGYRRIDAAGNVIEWPTPPHIDEDHYLSLLRGNYVGMHGAVMYRRQPLTACGGFDSSLPACEDYDLYLRLARTYPVVCHDTVIAEYRTYASSISSDVALMLPTALKVLWAQHRYLKKDPRRIQAYRVGVRYWKSLYAQQLPAQIGRCWRRKEHRKALRTLSVMIRYAPTQSCKVAYRLATRTVTPFRLSACRAASHVVSRRKEDRPCSALRALWYSAMRPSVRDPVFVICTARSGSTWLADCLNSHPMVSCEFEILNTRLVPYLDRLKSDFALRYYLDTLFKSIPERIRCGNVHLSQLEDFEISAECLVRWFPQARFIVLFRVSLLEQFVSLKLAETTGRWIACSSDGHDEPVITVDVDELLTFSETTKRRYAQLICRPTLFGRHLKVSYEELVEDRDGVFNEKIWPFLEVPSARINTVLCKQNRRSLEECLANFHEIKSVLDSGILENRLVT